MVHYCQELLEAHQYFRDSELYDRLTAMADAFIDVEPHRAVWRREKCQTTGPNFILPNTCPLATWPAPAPPGALLRVAQLADDGVPILLYAGGFGVAKPFERVVEILRQIGTRFKFIAFCSNTTEQDLNKFRAWAARQLPQVPHALLPGRKRSELLPLLAQADAGFIDYSYAYEPILNQKYCAPTKLYEYMASGLAVIGSNNPSLRTVIDAEEIGRTATQDTPGAMAAAAQWVLEDAVRLAGMQRRSRACFAEKYCYEKLCAPVVEELNRWLRNEIQRQQGPRPPASL